MHLLLRGEGRSAVIKAALWCQKPSAQIVMIICDACQSRPPVSMQEGIGHDGKGNDLAVFHIRLGGATRGVAAGSVLELTDVINDDEQSHDNILPAVPGDEIGDIGHGAPLCRVLTRLQRRTTRQFWSNCAGLSDQK